MYIVSCMHLCDEYEIQAYVSLREITTTMVSISMALFSESMSVHDYSKMCTYVRTPHTSWRYNENVLPNPFIYNMDIYTYSGSTVELL